MTTPSHAAAPTRAVLTLLAMLALAAGLWVTTPGIALPASGPAAPAETTVAVGDSDAVATPARRPDVRRRIVRATLLPLLLALAVTVRRRARRDDAAPPAIRPARWPAVTGRAPPALAG